ncbi:MULTISPECIES: BTAD domain-containing putative transcriptional regulator [unclassified Streptomyces]|uniref:ATP-binding protein n=1 Tax=unclassified Streptomyces TaxID=2593676 RepID=UPI0033F2D9A4
MTSALILLSRVACRGQEVGAPRMRALLALLADDVRTGCSTERLVAGLWPDVLPAHPDKALQVLVSRARSQLGADVIASTPTGYRLTFAEDQVDSSVLLRHAAASAERARVGDHTGSLTAAEAGLALWEGGGGDPDGAAADDAVAALRARCARVRGDLVRAQGLALARSGRHAEAAAPLTAAAAQYPRDEEVLAELLRGEAATVGPAAALTRYEDYRRELRDTLGTDPGAGLRAVQQVLLREQKPVARHGVPHEPNQLLGREEDIAAVQQSLRTARVVTVLGPGGIGKTRLAHAVSRRAPQRLVHAVPLAGVTTDEDVAAEVASALGAGAGRHGAVTGPAALDPVQAILGVLGSGPALLVLDNCEHVVQGAADLVRTLIASSRELRVLATSRAPLDLRSEAVYALPKLGLDVAVELFTQRARAARTRVELPSDAVTEVCRHLDGLPLAVELAAARVRVLSVQQIAHRIGDRFALLRGGARDAPVRHRTLHAVVEWSWNLLTEDARAALRTLSVFPGGFSAEAADHVLAGDALPLLTELTDQSLLTATDTPVGARFRMLETVREFSAARLAEEGEAERALGEFLAWAREFGVVHHDWVFGSDPRAVGARVKAEQDNLVSALRHAMARTDGPTTAALTAVLAALWSTDADYPRLAALAADTGQPLSHYRPEPDGVEVARAAAVLCGTSLFMNYGPQAGLPRQLVTLRRLPPTPPDTLLGAAAAVLGAVPDMLASGHDVLHELCGSDQPLVAGVAECVATYIWEYEHDMDRALASARRMTTALSVVAGPALRVMVRSRASELCLKAGRGDEAHEHLSAALDALPRLGDEHDYIGIRTGLALACLQREDPDEAEKWLRQADGVGTTPYDEFYSPDLGARAEIALARGQTETGLRLWRDAVQRMSSTGAAHGGGGPYVPGDSWLDPWALQIQSAAITAHAHAGRIDLVMEPLDRLRRLLRIMAQGSAQLPLELEVYGTVLHALGMAGVVSGDARAVRMIALAERMRVLREFQPTMSAARARQTAEDTDRAAYADAVSEYATLERHELCAATGEFTLDRA